MAISPRLDLRQTQSLVMTPQLQQAIKLLQLSNLEVQAYVEQELEQNPLLEREDGENATTQSPAEADAERSAAEAPAAPAEAPLLDAVDPSTRTASDSGEAPLDTDFSNNWTAEAGEGGTPQFEKWGTGRGGTFDDSESGLEQTLTREISLRDHLLEQLNVDIADPIDRIIGVQLIDMIDDAGYFTGDVATVAATLNCDDTRVEACLAMMQRLDPPGVFARSLRECLALQLRDKDRLDPAMEALLENLDLLAKRDFPALMRACGMSSEDLVEAVGEIKALNPKPGLVFDPAVAHAVIPDVLMRLLPDGSWMVELNQDTLPRVLVNTPYHARVSKEARSKADKEFIADRLQAANWLVKSLHQRAQTILKVATEIVRQQEAFFLHGVQHLRPLVLRDIATAISMHESTVSRVTTNKYLAAPQGIYELKYFFTSSIANSGGGEAHSAEAVRFRIKALIDTEPPDEILSDDRIVELLVKDGIDIARRTVAKYREAMRIPSSVQRRRDKALGEVK